MRDTLCNAEDLKETIDFNEEEIAEEREEIKVLFDDIEKGIQRYPRKNEEIIYDTKVRLFRLLYEMIRAKYSLGMECVNIEQDYLEMISIVCDIGYSKIGYVHFIQVFALGVLLEVSNGQLAQLVEVADEENLNDCLFDFLVHSYGLTRRLYSESYQKENPYKEAVQLINLSFENKEYAAEKLKDYMENKWFQGHYDYEWKNAHKRAGYVGFWSFETAALAKILKIDDYELQNNNHYPYDLAHYKSGKAFVIKSIIAVENEKTSGVGMVMEENKDLEQIIPDEFRNFINQVIADYMKLDDLKFWTKYELGDIWYTIDEFSQENKDKQLLGNIIVNVLVKKGYILQLDYKEDIGNYITDMKNYWKDEPVKIIQFELNNDQNYYTVVPQKAYLHNLYELDIRTVSIRYQ